MLGGDCWCLHSFTICSKLAQVKCLFYPKIIVYFLLMVNFIIIWSVWQIKYRERVLGLILVSPLCRAPSWAEWIYNKVIPIFIMKLKLLKNQLWVPPTNDGYKNIHTHIYLFIFTFTNGTFCSLACCFFPFLLICWIFIGFWYHDIVITVALKKFPKKVECYKSYWHVS